MTRRKDMILALEDSTDRVRRFELAVRLSIPAAHLVIENTANLFKQRVIESVEAACAISLDHDLHPPGVADAGDGMQVAEWLAEMKPACPIIIHTSNGEQSRRMQGVLEAARCEVRLAGAIGEDWIERDWITEIASAYHRFNP